MHASVCRRFAAPLRDGPKGRWPPPCTRRNTPPRPRALGGDEAGVGSAILPGFLDACGRFLCAGLGAAASERAACFAAVVFPPPDRQAEILAAMSDLASLTDISGLEGTFLRMLMQDDEDALRALLATLIEHNATLDAIRDAVADVRRAEWMASRGSAQL